MAYDYIYQTDTNDLSKKLENPANFNEWQTIALFPQMLKCMNGVLQYQQIDCHCNEENTECMAECLVQKYSFTANLLAIRLLCAIVK